MASEGTLEKIKCYRDFLNKSLGKNEDKQVFTVLEKLDRLPISLDLLQETGIGKTVNGYRKCADPVGQKAKGIVNKWKLLVQAAIAEEKTGESLVEAEENARNADGLVEKMDQSVSLGKNDLRRTHGGSSKENCQGKASITEDCQRPVSVKTKRKGIDDAGDAGDADGMQAKKFRDSSASRQTLKGSPMGEGYGGESKPSESAYHNGGYPSKTDPTRKRSDHVSSSHSRNKSHSTAHRDASHKDSLCVSASRSGASSSSLHSSRDASGKERSQQDVKSNRRSAERTSDGKNPSQNGTLSNGEAGDKGGRELKQLTGAELESSGKRKRTDDVEMEWQQKKLHLEDDLSESEEIHRQADDDLLLEQVPSMPSNNVSSFQTKSTNVNKASAFSPVGKELTSSSLKESVLQKETTGYSSAKQSSHKDSLASNKKSSSGKGSSTAKESSSKSSSHRESSSTSSHRESSSKSASHRESSSKSSSHRDSSSKHSSHTEPSTKSSSLRESSTKSLLHRESSSKSSSHRDSSSKSSSQRESSSTRLSSKELLKKKKVPTATLR